MKKKIEFDPKYREAIESGKYKVKTLDGDYVRIVCWDADETPHPIVGLVTLEGDTGVTAIKYNGNGEPGPQWNRNLLTIIIETDEEDLTEFEKCVVDMMWEIDGEYDIEAHDGYYEEKVRKYSDKLKELAYMEICQNEVLELPSWRYDPTFVGDKLFKDAAIKRNGIYDDDLYYNGYVINIAQLFDKLKKIKK